MGEGGEKVLGNVGEDGRRNLHTKYLKQDFSNFHPWKTFGGDLNHVCSNYNLKKTFGDNLKHICCNFHLHKRFGGFVAIFISGKPLVVEFP